MALIEAVDGAVHSAAAGRVELPLSSGLLIDAAVSPVVRAEGDGEMAEAAIVVLSDVTIRRNAVRMKQEFFSNASHELKTPITSIRASPSCSVPRPTSSRKSGRSTPAGSCGRPARCRTSSATSS